MNIFDFIKEDLTLNKRGLHQPARKIAVIADYRIDKHVDEEQVREMLTWAKEFLKAGENYLKQVF
ncbi:MAG: hypothetical protein ABIU06_12745 [Anaerolineales bacterium]